MSLRFQVTIDAHDPAGLAEFWKVALGYRTDDPPPGFASWDEVLATLAEERRNDAFALIDPDRVGPRVLFVKVPEAKATKNRVHLDVAASRRDPDPAQRRRLIDEHVARLVAAGGTRVADRSDAWGSMWTVMTDPEGNEFCVQ